MPNETRDPAAVPEVRGRSRSKMILITGLAVGSAVALATATQSWIEIALVPGASAVDAVSVTGQSLNQSLSPLAIAVLASALVLTLAGPAFRRVLGVVIAALGAGVAAIAVAVLQDPALASRSAIAEVTGIAGEAQADLVDAISPTVWPTAALIVGLILAVIGILVVFMSGRWKVGGRKYRTQSDQRPGRAGSATHDRIADWDALSDGDDPTQTP